MSTRLQAMDAIGMYQAMLASMINPLVITDEDGIIHQVNKASCDIFNRSEQELLGRRLRDFFVDPAFADTLIASLKEKKAIRDIEATLTITDNTSVALLISGSMLHHSDGLPVGLLFIGMDMSRITDLLHEIDVLVASEVEKTKQLDASYRELDRTHVALVQASRRAGIAEMAISTLHSLGNLLNSVNTSIVLLSEHLHGSRAQKIKKGLEKLVAHQETMNQVAMSDPTVAQIVRYLSLSIDDLINQGEACAAEVASLMQNIEHIFEVVRSQQRFAHPVHVEENLTVGQLVETALTICNLPSEDIRVVRSLGAQQNQQLFIDRVKFLQILTALLSNAQTALMASRNDLKAITISCRIEDDRTKLYVKDNGIGIDSENHTTIFQLGYSTKTGPGYGLHTSANMAKEMGGALTLQSSALNQGATFCFQFPYKAS